MKSQYPAIIIGGSLCQGKSIIATILSDKLQSRQIPHFHYQAACEATGTWYHPQQRAAESFSHTAPWSSYYSDDVESILRHRPMPFLVEIGGTAIPSEPSLFASATHAIVLGATPEEIDSWATTLYEYDITILAELLTHSLPEDVLESEFLPIQAKLGGLESGCNKNIGESTTWQTLLKSVQRTVRFSEAQVWQHHWGQLDSLYLPFHTEQWRRQQKLYDAPWCYHDLIALRQVLETTLLLALYGDSPLWITAALALHLEKAPLCFDSCLGWLALPELQAVEETERCPWKVEIQEEPLFVVLTICLRYPRITHKNCIEALLPLPSTEKPVVLQGNLPRWLFAALALYYYQHHYRVGITITGTQEVMLLNGSQRDTISA